ncbi:helix-turn-helix domain-containing protein [Legionella pneumophila]|uniref:helix-turn-helix domain-containing protein n=1 Tax=Legionella pneumophila TaxID=446 RepID=UPI000875EDBF|nr:helix-turn-helix domain-containing protein [Legionella pneumophila]AOW53807.1 hypothetical protein BE841_14915 [Legionella pneumophila subsp. pneumophila]AOW56709.1 hypothetical protein BE842_14970 [Legionella pneumophila subsp. pneumophila]AOW65407.1 hypothetical protein BE845_14920 [Legionella pneumophila subsp. pneumophila]
MGGRPKKLNSEKAKLAQELYNEKNRAIKHICEWVDVSRLTLYKYLKNSDTRNFLSDAEK